MCIAKRYFGSGENFSGEQVCHWSLEPVATLDDSAFFGMREDSTYRTVSPCFAKTLLRSAKVHPGENQVRVHTFRQARHTSKPSKSIYSLIRTINNASYKARLGSCPLLRLFSRSRTNTGRKSHPSRRCRTRTTEHASQVPRGLL